MRCSRSTMTFSRFCIASITHGLNLVNVSITKQKFTCLPVKNLHTALAVITHQFMCHKKISSCQLESKFFFQFNPVNTPHIQIDIVSSRVTLPSSVILFTNMHAQLLFRADNKLLTPFYIKKFVLIRHYYPLKYVISYQELSEDEAPV